MTCATCGASLGDDAAFCSQCGASTGRPAAAPEPTILERLQASLGQRYRIERELGRGGMATVFLAQDLRHDRSVAIKVLHPELGATVGADRFDREIRVAAKLQHPHILTLYDSGDADHLLFYVMPFVEGESLRDRLNRERMLPVDEALRITLEVADALGYAHGLGIVHRDIKPENILLSGGHALVADFGIARAVSAADEHKLTQTGTAVGTPLYMSPEQALGDEVGPPSDLYSLACVAYEMLTGQPPFTGASARAIMARHTMEAVPSIRLVRDAVPEEFEEAVLWALAKVPADRPQSAAQLAEALGTPLAATATRRAPSRMRVTPARISGARRPAAWYRRPWVLAAGAGVGVVAGAGAWLALQGGRAAAPAAGELDPRRVAVLYFEDRGGGRLSYLAEGLTEGLITALRDVAALRVVSAGGAAQVRGGALPLDSVARRLDAGTLVRGEVEEDGGDVRVTVRLVDGGSGAEFERASFRRAAGEPLQLRDDLVQQVERLVRTRLGSEIRLRDERAGTRSAEAWVLLQRAQRLVKQADSAGTAGDTAAFSRWAAEADSVAAVAERADARWTEPVVLRAQLAYRRSRRAVEDPLAANRWIAAGLGHLQRALALERGDPDALELRGNLQYWKWLLGLEPDAGRAQALLQAAQADLELAVRQRPLQAGAWATLSHLYNNSPTKTSVDVVLAARSAYEADAFLANADVILARLFFGTYDLGQFVEARHWCAEGARRFPANPRFTECALWLLTTRAEDPDPARAWRLLDTLMSRTSESDTAYQRLNGRLAVAAVLARAGLADSARAVAAGARGTPDLDPSRDLANIAAFVYTLLGDTAAALEQLASYLAANPARRAAYAEDPGWWFRGLDTHPGFQRLVRGGR